MDNQRTFNPRSDATRPSDPPGPGDDIPCEKCGAVALDTGLECSECGHDNYQAVMAGLSGPNVGGEARLAAHQPSQTTTATPQGVASTD